METASFSIVETTRLMEISPTSSATSRILTSEAYTWRRAKDNAETQGTEDKKDGRNSLLTTRKVSQDADRSAKASHDATLLSSGRRVMVASCSTSLTTKVMEKRRMTPGAGSRLKSEHDIIKSLITSTLKRRDRI